jgi:hypothetical protein
MRQPSGTRDQFIFVFHENYLQTFAVLLLWGTLSGGRPGVCNLLVQELMGLASAGTLGSKSRRSGDRMRLGCRATVNVKGGGHS